jgi:NADH-quinone oxidoreductase subunit N
MVAEPAQEIAADAEGADDAGVVNADDALAGMRHFLALIVAILAAVTCTFGNFAAYAQTNIKRLLAYSTIAHAGYMMLPVSAALMLAGVDNGKAESAIASLAIYIAIYLFMNLGAFAIVAFLRNALHTEEIDDYAGLVWTSPGVVVCFSIILFSLVGMPPLAGFIGKFLIFASLADGYQVTGHTFLLVLLIIGGINTAISLFYYLRVVKVMTIDAPSGETSSRGLSLLSVAGAYILLVTLPLLLLFVKWNELNGWTQIAARHLF